METLATLAMDIDVRSADPAEAKLASLKRTAKELEDQAVRTAGAAKALGTGYERAGSAAKAGEASLSKYSGALSEQAQLMLRNAQFQDRWAKDAERASKQTEALTKRVDALRASMDPLAAVEVTLAQRTRLLDEALAKGAISAEQHAEMLAKVHSAAKAGVDQITRYNGGLKNGGQYATQFSYQLNDIATGLLSGQKPMQVLAQQGGQVFQIFQMAAIEAGSFKGAVKGLMAEVAPLVATLGPWVVGLAAVGAATAYLVNQHNKQAEAVKDLSEAIAKQRKELESTAPLMFQTSDNANLAAEGQRNFEAWIKKTNVSLAEQNRLLRENALNELNKQSLAAGENLRKAQEQFDRVNKGGPTIGMSPGGFGVVAPVRSTDPRANSLFKGAEENLKNARATADAVAKRLAQMAQAPDAAFSDANRRSASTPRDMTDERSSQLSREIATARAAELQAQMALTKDVEARAAYERQIIQAESDARQAELAGKRAAIEDDKGLSDAKKKELRAGYEALASTEQRVASLKLQAVDQALAGQILQSELTARREASAYLDQMARYAAEQATTLAERNAIERASLRRRQDDEAYSLAASNELKVVSGEISAMAAAEANLRQRNLAVAEEESVLRKQRLAAEQASSEKEAAWSQIMVDLLRSNSDLSRSTTERRQIAEKILELEQAEERRKLELAAVSDSSTETERDIAKARLAILDKVHAAQRGTDNERLQAAYREHYNAVNSVTDAFRARDWNGVVNGLLDAFANLKAAFSRTGTTMDKVAAVAAVAAGIGNAVGGTGGAALTGAASGAMAGFTLGGPIGAAIGGIIGGIGGILGSSSAKKKARQQAAAQAAAEEAQRQQTIADTQFSLDVALLRAQGKEQEAVNKEREKEIARLTALSPALAESQKQLWALDDAANAAAAAAEKAAAIESKRASIQDEIDKLTMSSADLLAKARAKERAEAVALDPTLGDLIDKFYGLQDAATAQADATKAAAEASERAVSAAERQAEAMKALGDSFGNAYQNAEELSKSLQSFADSLLNELGVTGQQQNYDAIKSAFLSNAAIGNYDQSLAQAFIEASRATSTSGDAFLADVNLARGLALDKVSGLKTYQSDVVSLWRAIQSGTSGLPGFASGGSMVIGGNTGLDQNVLSINGSPVARVNYGETLAITPAGANDNSALAGVRAEMAELRRLFVQSVFNSDRLATQLARWDYEGLPQERTY